MKMISLMPHINGWENNNNKIGRAEAVPRLYHIKYMQLSTLQKFLEEYLGPKPIFDSGANGLQIKGNENIKRIALGVSANLALFEEAVKLKCDAIIVHHGLWLNDLSQHIHPYLQKRLKVLFDNNISLFGFHYLLDSNEKIGNAVSILKLLGAKNFQKFGHMQNNHWGFSGELKETKSLNKIIDQCNLLFKSPLYERGLGDSTVFSFGKSQIKKIAVTTGSGCFSLSEAKEKGIDLVITGDIKEPIPHLCKELEMNLIAGGHYQTEKYGIQALGEIIKKKFDVEVKFIEV